jgi:hypothetical protein
MIAVAQENRALKRKINLNLYAGLCLDGARTGSGGGVIVAWEWWCPGDTVGFGWVAVGDE